MDAYQDTLIPRYLQGLYCCFSTSKLKPAQIYMLDFPGGCELSVGSLCHEYEVESLWTAPSLQAAAASNVACRAAWLTA